MIKKFLLVVVLACASFSGRSLQAAEPLDEKALQKLMKEVGDTSKRFRKTQDDKNSAQMAKDATPLAEIYKETVGFWKGRKIDDAMKWSQESETVAKATAAAAREENWDKVKTSLQGLMKNCKSCHDAHREKLADGSYRIK